MIGARSPQSRDVQRTPRRVADQTIVSIQESAITDASAKRNPIPKMLIAWSADSMFLVDEQVAHP
jgi:hypothetical protein